MFRYVNKQSKAEKINHIFSVYQTTRHDKDMQFFLTDSYCSELQCRKKRNSKVLKFMAKKQILVLWAVLISVGWKGLSAMFFSFFVAMVLSKKAAAMQSCLAALGPIWFMQAFTRRKSVRPQWLSGFRTWLRMLGLGFEPDGVQSERFFVFFNQTVKMAQHDYDDKTCFQNKELKESNKT